MTYMPDKQPEPSAPAAFTFQRQLDLQVGSDFLPIVLLTRSPADKPESNTGRPT